MIAAGAEALFAAHRAFVGVHEVAEELPACGRGSQHHYRAYTKTQTLCSQYLIQVKGDAPVGVSKKGTPSSFATLSRAAPVGMLRATPCNPQRVGWISRGEHTLFAQMTMALRK